MGRFWICLGLVIFALALTPVAHAATIRVPADQPMIQLGINAAAEGDTVLVAPGNYTGDWNRDLSFLGKNIVLRSEAGCADTIIDCEAGPSDHHRAAIFNGGETELAVIDGFTITNGYVVGESPSFMGGGITCIGSSPTIRNCIFYRNRSNVGGAMFFTQGSMISAPTVSNCVFRENEAVGLSFSGGAVSSVSSLPTFIDCSFFGNSAAGGGAVVVDQHSSFVRCVFSGNSGSDGGAMLVVTGNHFMDHCLFIFNSAAGQGGAIAAAQATIELDHCTLAYNTSSVGSGVSLVNGTVMLATNSIIASGTVGAAVECDGGSSAILECCDVFGNEGGDWVGCTQGQGEISGNFSADPEFCGIPGPLLNFSIAASSPCAPDNSPTGCGLVGAVGVGCGPVAVERSTWGAIKAHYR